MEAITTVHQNGLRIADEKKYDLYNQFGVEDQNALHVEKLCKVYKPNHHALKDVTFSIKTGEVCVYFCTFSLLNYSFANNSIMVFNVI